MALNLRFEECEKIHGDLKKVILDEIEDETELDAFFDEVDEVMFINADKLNKLDFLVSGFDKLVTPSRSAPLPLSVVFLYAQNYLI